MSLSSNTLEATAAAIAAHLGSRCDPTPERAVSGGSINECYLWRSDAGPLFVKLAGRSSLAMLEAEADGLRELAGARAVRVPEVLGLGCSEHHAFLALEWIDTGGSSRLSEQKLGEQLAAQHRVAAPRFGWKRDNTIGRTTQLNNWMDDWISFFRERRLRYQLDLAVRKGYASLLERQGERLLDALPRLLEGHRPQASLLHGDLWGGNWLTDSRGEPVIFDPAVYYGDREADLAMTRLFGGFGREFYAAYEAAWPRDPGFETRLELYNLYHVLNHANLFGGGYARQASSILARLLT